MSLINNISDGASALARSFRRSLQRDRLMANLRTLITVVPLTVLVWVYAEQQQLVTQKDVPLHIAVQSGDPAHRLMTLLAPSDGTIHVTLQGSQIGIDRVTADLQRTFVADALDVTIANSLPVGPRQPLPLLDQLKDNRIFASHAVTVVSCSPETLVIGVDELEEQEVPVKAPADVPGLIKATFIPPTVKLRGPKNLLYELEQRGELAAIADLSNEPSLKQPGDHNNLTVHFLPQENITFQSPAVVADIVVGEPDESIAVSPVPVMIMAPKWLMDNYKFDYKEVLAEPVTLVGPKAQIDLVDPHNPKLIAVVELQNTDALYHGQKTIAFQPQGLPDGVRVKPDPAPRTIEIGVDPR